MRHPVSSATAAAMCVLAVTGVVVWFHAAGTTPAFADFLQPLLNAKTVKYKRTTDMTSLSAELQRLPAETRKELMHSTDQAMELGAHRSRTESGRGKSKIVHIWDGNQGKQLMLQPAEKRATLYNYADMPKAKTPNGGDPVAAWRSFSLDARNKPNVKRESLGERQIDGRRVVGFRVTLPAAVFSLWGDPQTGAPVRIETTVTLMPNIKITESDFEFNVPLDESLFSVEPPAGYEVTVVQEHKTDSSPEKEKDLLEMFRYYSQMSGGRFPDLLDMQWLTEARSMIEWSAANLTHPPMAKRQQEQQEAQTKFQRGMMFTVQLPKEADWHYAGRGVSRGTTGRPIFWYRPKGTKKYRVIFADLSVGEADAAPHVPDATAAQLEQDLIEMFRQYSQLSGGPFPDALDLGSIASVAYMKQVIFNSLRPQQKPSAKQAQEVAEALAKLQRGLIFHDLLPKEADAHYAGKGVSRGAADRPIFWYRPKDAKKYRVIYADLAVREAETPPHVPAALPEQDLIDVLRSYSELSGKPFPAKLDVMSLLQPVSMKLYMKFPPAAGQQCSAKHLQELSKIAWEFQLGVTFADSLPPEADAHYAGKGVTLGAADKPIFWYRPKDSKKYRVLYADLSVRDAVTPPSAPVARPEDDLLDALRSYSQSSGGLFPDSPDDEGFSQILMKKFHLAKGQQPSAQQLPEAVETLLKFQPALTFIASLPPQADAHYAGKGVSLGAADRPIFWYRPNDAKKYRVIYADLSVREADTPPSVPHAQPVPAPPSLKK